METNEQTVVQVEQTENQQQSGNPCTQSRVKSPIFWIGLASAVYTAVLSTGIAAGVEMPWYVGAIGTALSAVLVYCNGNNPSLSDKY